MPNWITNNVKIIGQKEDLDLFVKKYFTNNNIDFNKITPRPESLNICSGGYEIEALTAYLTDNCKKTFSEIDSKKVNIIKNSQSRYNLKYDSTLKILEREGSSREYDFSINRDSKKYMTLYDAGKIYYENIVNYGSPDWYEWSINNWGTKWEVEESYFERVSDKEIFLNFDTAWDMPCKIFEKLAKDNPNIKIEVKFADEDFGYNCGHSIYKNGKNILDIYYSDFCEESKELATEVLGYSL